MAEDLYERYKDALRTGHVAVLRGRLTDALASYREAASIAPERALPHSSLGGVLLRLGHVDEALFEYDAAVELAPRDEGVLLGRAEALVAAGRKADAAIALDRVAEVQETTGRIPEACDTAQRATDLQPSEARRSRHYALLQRMAPSPAEATAEEALGRALRLLEPSGGGRTGDVTRSEPVAGTIAEGGRAPSAAAEASQATETADAAEAMPDAAQAAGATQVPEPAAPDLTAMAFGAEDALDRGDREQARQQLIELARARAAAGLFDAALDAAHLALAVAPADPRLHLALVELYLTRGWQDLAGDKLALLGRLAELVDDEPTRAEVAAAVARSFPDDERLQAYLEPRD